MSPTAYIPLILSGVLLNAAGQVFLKKGMIKLGHFDFSAFSIWEMLLRAATNFYVIGGLCCYGISLILWMMTLSRVNLSFAYPMLSLGFVVTAFAGYWFFGETLTLPRILGIALIMMGVYFVSRS